MQRSELIDLVARGRVEGWDSDDDYSMDLVVDCSPYPFLDLDGKTVQPAVISVWHMEKLDAGKTKCHSVVMARTTNEYFVWCGDTYLEGRSRKSGASPEQRRQLALADVHVTQASAAEAAMANVFGAVGKNTGCNFWALWKSGQRPCKHVYTVLLNLEQQRELVATLDQLADAYDDLVNGASSTAPAIQLTEAALVDRLAFRRPVLFEGDRGSGKTMAVRSFAKQQGHALIQIDGHEGLEAGDLLGCWVVAGPSGWVWKDGRLSQAFRLAGKAKTMLMIDEMLRIPARHLSPLLSALSPFDGRYAINTGRIVDVVDGVGREERLECPVGNLAVFATTNVGSEYAVDALDPALAERFMLIRKDTTPEDVERVGKEALGEKGFDPAIAEKLKAFHSKMLQMVQQGMAVHSPTLRTLCNAIDLAETEQEIGLWLRQTVLQWVGRDLSGHPVPEQVDAVTRLVEKEFA
jgi:MoxR-like ATPase